MARVLVYFLKTYSSVRNYPGLEAKMTLNMLKCSDVYNVLNSSILICSL